MIELIKVVHRNWLESEFIVIKNVPQTEKSLVMTSEKREKLKFYFKNKVRKISHYEILGVT